MKILGIDPGMAIVGYGLIKYENEKYELLTSGSIQTDKKLDDSKRLLEIFNDLSKIIETYQPDCASVEQLFFFKNQKTIIDFKQCKTSFENILKQLSMLYEYYGDYRSLFMRINGLDDRLGLGQLNVKSLKSLLIPDIT